jgi:hypothetical protein
MSKRVIHLPCSILLTPATDLPQCRSPILRFSCKKTGMRRRNPGCLFLGSLHCKKRYEPESRIVPPGRKPRALLWSCRLLRNRRSPPDVARLNFDSPLQASLRRSLNLRVQTETELPVEPIGRSSLAKNSQSHQFGDHRPRYDSATALLCASNAASLSPTMRPRDSR